MLHRGALSHFVDPSAQGHLASDKWRILDAGPDLKSARLESRLEALGSGVTGPGPLSEPHSACFPWLACPVPTHVCLYKPQDRSEARSCWCPKTGQGRAWMKTALPA